MINKQNLLLRSPIGRTTAKGLNITTNEQVYPEFWDGEPTGSPFFPRIFAHRMERGKKADAVKLFGGVNQRNELKKFPWCCHAS